jgi:ADP-heptose:LPS heptosyltransferase
VLGAIGDTLLSSSIVWTLKRQYPGVRIVLICSVTNQQIAPLLPQFDSFVTIPLYRPLTALRRLRREAFDLIIDANQWLRISAVYCCLAGASRTIGFRTPGQRRHYAYTDATEHRADRHELDNYRALLSPLSLTTDAPPQVVADTTHVTRMRRCCAGPFVVFHPWAGGSRAALKQWSDHNWIALAEVLASRHLSIVVTGAPSDVAASEALVRLGRDRNLPMRSVAGEANLAEVAALMSLARLVVSVNTGIAHLAAAVGVPVVTLHGPTNPKRWRPIGPHCVAIVPDAPPHIPTGYLNLGFEFPPDVPPCMDYISVSSVIDAIDAVLLQQGAASRDALVEPK